MPAPTIKNRKKVGQSRFYEIDDETTLPSVTTILQAIGKPALIAWAAKEEREMVLVAAADLYADIAEMEPRLSAVSWAATMQTRLTKQKAHQKLLAKAGEIGTQAHECIEWELKKTLGAVEPYPVVQDAATWAYMAWQDWAKAVKLKPLLIEQVLFSRVHGYAGTMDLLCEVHVPGLINYFINKKLPVPEILSQQTREYATALADWKTGKGIYSEADLQNAAYRHALAEMGHCTADFGLIVRLPKVTTDPEFEVKVVGDSKPLMDIFLATKTLWTWMQIAENAYQSRVNQSKQELKKELEISATEPNKGIEPQVSPDVRPSTMGTGGGPTAAAGAEGEKSPSVKKQRRTKNGVPMAIIPPVTEKEREMGFR